MKDSLASPGKFLILGSNGLLGRSLADKLEVSGYSFRGLTRHDIDLTSVIELPSFVQPGDVFINCAAFTDVAAAESNIVDAEEINALGPARLARACKDRNVHFIYISTDYVFDGLQNYPYEAQAKTNPVQIYGKSKRLGETLCLNEGSTVVRTSWLYGKGQNNFVSSIMSKLKKNEQIEVVDDQVGTPTSALFVAEQVINNARLFTEKEIIHVVPEGSTSWFGLASEVALLMKLEPLKMLVPVKTARNAVPVRPKYSVLRPSPKIENIDWKTVLGEFWDSTYT